MEEISYVKLIFLKSLAERLEKDANGLKVALETCVEKEVGFKQLSRLERLIRDYNELRTSIVGVPEMGKLTNFIISSLPYVPSDFLYIKQSVTGKESRKSTLFSSDISEAISTLETISLRCHALISSLEVLLKPKIPLDTITKLGSLREELKKLEDGLKPEVSSDLNEAIGEMEQGHSLAASMIASRIICYVLDKIQGKDDDEKVGKLVEFGIIEKERKDEKERFVSASRLSRNLLSHIPGLCPKPDEALQLVSSAVTFTRYLAALPKN